MSASRPVPQHPADLAERGRRPWRDRLLVEVRESTPAGRRALLVLAVALIAVGAIAFAVLLIGVLTHTGPQRLDVPVERWFDARRASDTTTVMSVLATVFGPVGMPIVVAVTLIVWIALARHLWRPLLLLGGMVAGVVLAQVLAPIVRHPRPPIAQMLLAPDHTFSFPSGHVLGMADFFLLTAFLLASRIRRPWFTAVAVVVAVLAVIAQVTARLYLGYHWFTDVTASVALSCIIVGMVIAIDTHRTVRVGSEPLRRGTVPQTEGT